MIPKSRAGCGLLLDNVRKNPTSPIRMKGDQILVKIGVTSGAKWYKVEDLRIRKGRPLCTNVGSLSEHMHAANCTLSRHYKISTDQSSAGGSGWSGYDTRRISSIVSGFKLLSAM